MDKSEIIDNVEKSINGNKSAITSLYNYTYSNMYLLAYNLCRNEDTAEDILQESYITAFTNLEKLRNKESFEFWLKGIVVNEWRRYVRNDKSSRLISIDDITDTKSAANTVQGTVERKEVHEEIWQQVNNLPENQRICIILFYYHDMSIEEIASMLNIPKGSVKSRLYYAKVKLRKYLSGKDMSFNSVIPASIMGGICRNNEVMLSKIFAALDTTAKGSAVAVTHVVGGGILLKIAIGIISAVTAVGLTCELINLRKETRPAPQVKTFSTTAATETTATTIVTTTITSATVTTKTTTATRAEIITFDYQNVNGGIQLTKYTGSSGSVVIPETIGGKPVIAIGDGAFQRCGVLQRVEIPATVKSIGSNAFKDCVNLKSASFGGVSQIGDAAFLGCNSLKKVSIPGSVKSIGIYAFAYCSSLAEVNVSEGTGIINYCAFYDCHNLRKVVLPGTVNVIGNNAFAGAHGELTMCVKEGTYAHAYALDNGFNFEFAG